MIHNIALVTVTYNSKHLASWFSQTANNFKYVFVVDNASEDATADEFNRAIPHAHIIKQDNNIGFGSANNVGFKVAAAVVDLVLFINPDCQIEAAEALKLAQALEKYSELGIVFPLVQNVHGELPRVLLCDFSKPYKSKITQVFDIARAKTDVISPACVDGACLMVRTKDFLSIGGFNQDLFMYCEEDDLGLRMQSIHKQIGIHLRSSATHLGGASTKPSLLLQVKKAYHVRWSRFYMTNRYISSAQRVFEVGKVLLLTPFALCIYGLLLRRNLFLKWMGWSFAALDGIFMSRFFRKFLV